MYAVQFIFKLLLNTNSHVCRCISAIIFYRPRVIYIDLPVALFKFIRLSMPLSYAELYECFALQSSFEGSGLDYDMKKDEHLLIFFHGWGGGIRTPECWDQNPVPYHLATPQDTDLVYHFLRRFSRERMSRA